MKTTRLLFCLLVTCRLIAGGPAYLAPKPVPALQQMEVLRELGKPSPQAYATLLGMKNDPEAARSFLLSVLEERLAIVRGLIDRGQGDEIQNELDQIKVKGEIFHVKKWSPRLRKDRLDGFYAACRQMIEAESD